MWNAVLEAAQQLADDRADVMAVGTAGEEVVVIRVHALDKDLVKKPAPARRSPPQRLIG